MSLLKVDKITGKTGTTTGALTLSGDTATFVSGISTPNPKEFGADITLGENTTTTYFGVVKVGSGVTITIPSTSIFQVI